MNNHRPTALQLYRKTNAFTILHVVVIVISLSSMSCLALSLPLCLMPIVSKVLLYRNPSLQCWLRGRHTVANDQFCEQATVGSNTVDNHEHYHNILRSNVTISDLFQNWLVP